MSPVLHEDITANVAANTGLELHQGIFELDCDFSSSLGGLQYQHQYCLSDSYTAANASGENSTIAQIVEGERHMY